MVQRGVLSVETEVWCGKCMTDDPDSQQGIMECTSTSTADDDYFEWKCNHCGNTVFLRTVTDRENRPVEQLNQLRTRMGRVS